MNQQFQAANNLATLSQSTHYLSDWKDGNIAKRKQKKPKEIITEEEHHQQYHGKGRRVPLRKEYSESNLKKWEQRITNINKIQYPLLDNHNYFEQESSFQLLKRRPSIPSIFHASPISISMTRKNQQVTQRISKIIEEGLIQKKLSKIKKQMELQLQREESLNDKKLERRHQSTHLPKLSRHFRGKKSTKNPEQRLKVSRNEENDMKNLKHELQEQKRKFSMPILIKLHR